MARDAGKTTKRWLFAHPDRAEEGMVLMDGKF
jgi:hypothetical protein